MKSTTTAYPLITNLAKLSLLFVAALTFFALMPQQSFAYDTTEQSAVQLNEDTFLFQVTYHFNFANRDSEHPLLAQRTATITEAYADQVQYDVIDASGDSVVVEDIAAVVLSETPVLKNRHYFQTDEAIHATLFVVAKLSPAQVMEEGSVKMRMHWLPFTLIKGEQRRYAHVPAEDLNDFVTPVVTW
jgi:hypothetical protein